MRDMENKGVVGGNSVTICPLSTTLGKRKDFLEYRLSGLFYLCMCPRSIHAIFTLIQGYDRQQKQKVT